LGVDADYTYFMSTSNRPPLNREGVQKLAEYREDLVASGRYKPQPMVSNIIKFVQMPVSSLAVSAGTGAFLDEGNFEMVSFPETSVPEGADFGLRVSGDSMEPVYHDGQIVWVQQSDHVAVGSVGIFIYDGEGYIKVYDEREPDEADREAFTGSYGEVYMQPVMVSYNQKYAPRVISANAGFQVVGRVL
jgi:phage repressor protein C with HTH and peptisase S24 domain